MAQVKVQTSAPLAGPGLSPTGVPPAAMASPGSLGLQQPSVNGTGPAPPPGCLAPSVGYGDHPVSASSPGRTLHAVEQPMYICVFILLNLSLTRKRSHWVTITLISESWPRQAVKSFRIHKRQDTYAQMTHYTHYTNAQMTHYTHYADLTMMTMLDITLNIKLW